MKIAILSDTHDNVVNTLAVMEHIEKMGAEALIFCGDFCSPGPAIAMGKFKGPIYAVFGNNDGDQLHIVTYMKKEGNENVTFFEEAEGFFTFSGKRIALTHYPKYAIPIAKTGEYDLVCFGHDHTARIEKHGDCLAVNPGTLNPNPFRPGRPPTFAIYDAARHEAMLYGLDGNPL